MRLKAIIGATLLFLAHSASAQTQFCAQKNNTLNNLLGLDSSSGTIYANISSPTNECSCTQARFSSSNTDTDKALSILLAARLADQQVRIDFIEGQGCNAAVRVYLQK